MDFELTDEQLSLQRAARDVLDHESSAAVVRRVTETGEGADELWATLCALDWPALSLPADLGGLGQSWIEQAVVLEELGRAVAPGPFLATVTQFVPAVLHSGSADQHKRWVGAVAAGELTGTIAVDEGNGSWSPDHVEATATPDGDGYRLGGRKRFVHDGATADEIVTLVRLDGAPTFVVVPGDAVGTDAVRDPVDATLRHADLELDGIRLGPDRVLAAGGAAAVDRTLEEATAAVALSTVGTCQRVLDMTVAHVKEREQFGVPVGSFQAVKHKLVDMYRDVERARALAYFAALCFTEGDDRRTIAASMAKAAAGEAQRRVVQDGLQLHGGIGYTWEHDLHLYLRRAKVGELHFGNAAHHRARVARLFLASRRGR